MHKFSQILAGYILVNVLQTHLVTLIARRMDFSSFNRQNKVQSNLFRRNQRILLKWVQTQGDQIGRFFAF
jgi:hypothetical protein